MASRSIKVRAVFRELHQVLGGQMPAGEILSLAAKLVEASIPIPAQEDGLAERLVSHRTPLDTAFSDGGWRILKGEQAWMASAFSDEVPVRTSASKWGIS